MGEDLYFDSNEYLRTEEGSPPPSGKTKTWDIISVRGNYLLGGVKWCGRWRRYAFYPEPEMIFEHNCMRDLADFCEQRTAEHKK